jgi:hypothetical protein
MQSDNDMYENIGLDESQTKLIAFQKREAEKEAIEHRDAVLNLKAVLKTDAGRSFIKFLLKSFDVGELPSKGLTGVELHETIGFLRSGQSIFQIVSQAEPEVAAKLLANLEREKYEKLQELYVLENG